jgi:hypothetical protein
MRRTHVVALVALTATAVGAAVMGCFSSADECEKTLSCGSPSGTGTTSTTSTGTGGGPNAECVPSANASPIAEDCGVFVALDGDDAADGTQGEPVKTLLRAIELAQEGTGRVYACGQAFPEAVEVPAGVSIYGGLDCQSDWSYDKSNRTSIEPAADMVPLKLLKGSGVTRIEDVDARAADATLPGGSSVAVIVDGAKAEIARCDFTAGAGAAGAKGETPAEVGPTSADDPAIKGEAGSPACTAGSDGNAGGAMKANVSCDMSVGGAGGNGREDKGDNGVDGTPSGAAGKGGVGQPVAGAWSCVTGAGQIGDNGADGTSGLGAQGPGTISPTGYIGAAGAAGTAGAPGQGGGGGGGAKGKAACNGASGGGGGAGGCGGAGGLGGQAGGSSIAVISVNATLTFTDVNLKAGNGGTGGDGGDGQVGGIGGSGGVGGAGMSTLKGCNGGEGGQGGFGGRGGGGLGGHSLGIAHTGKAPPKASISTGMPGAGGMGADAAGNGASGQAKNTLEIPAAM